MAYDDSQVRDALIRAHKRKRVLRVVILLCFGLCGSMISAVLLSQPQVAARIEAMVEDFNMRLSGPSTAVTDDAPAPAPPAAAADPDNRPAVRSMPTSRVPVRRAAGDISG